MCTYVFLKTVNELEDPKSMLKMTKVNSAKESPTVVGEKTEDGYSGRGGNQRSGFFLIVEDRNANTLITIIKKFV